MRVYLVSRSKLIHPFGVPASACALGGETFAGYRERTLKALKLGPPTVVDDDTALKGPALVLAEDTWVTRRALRGFLKQSAPLPRAARLALPPSRLMELYAPLQDLARTTEGQAAFDVAHLPRGQEATARELFALGEEGWVQPPYRELIVDVPVPRHLMGRASKTLASPLTSTVAMRVRHWLHVLRAGTLLPQVALIEAAGSQPIRSTLRALLSLRAGKAQTLSALRRRFVFRGRGGFIHPTATVESSVLGRNVRVGAYAYVVNAVLGDDVIVEDRAHIIGSAIGAQSFVSRNSSISFCSVFADADACTNGIQGCVIGPRCGLTSFARPLDLIPGGEVQVDDNGQRRGVGELPCGVAFGPDVFVGADVTIAPGRAIPGGLSLVARPSGVLRRLPAEAKPGVAWVQEGALFSPEPKE